MENPRQYSLKIQFDHTPVDGICRLLKNVEGETKNNLGCGHYVFVVYFSYGNRIPIYDTELPTTNLQNVFQFSVLDFIQCQDSSANSPQCSNYQPQNAHHMTTRDSRLLPTYFTQWIEINFRTNDLKYQIRVQLRCTTDWKRKSFAYSLWLPDSPNNWPRVL